MRKSSRIYVAGHTGMVGSAMVDHLVSQGYHKIMTPTNRIDLTDQKQVYDWFKYAKPEYVFVCAAKVGGIKANNQYRADFIYDNLMIQTNLIDMAYRFDVRKLLFLGSSCIYPRHCPQPIREDYLLGGYLEQTNEPYAVAKIAGIKMVESYRRQYGCDFISVMPCNLYGPGDNFNIETGHVIPSLMRKAQTLDHIDVWGSGKARREFMHVDDLAEAMLFLMQQYSDDSPINVGTGVDMTIEDLVQAILDVTRFKGTVSFDRSMAEGVMHKLLDVSRINQLGWSSKINIYDGLESTYKWLNLAHDQGHVRV